MAFLRYLSPQGRYLGFDAWEAGVRWCTENLEPQHPGFHFHTVAASNNYYVAPDSGEPNTFDLSFVPHGSFDCVFAISVFTHLKRADASQYLRMVHDALARSGLAYLTFFVIDEHAEANVLSRPEFRAVKEREPGVWHGFERRHFFTGYAPDVLHLLFKEHRLDVVNESPGKWAAKPNASSWQDVFVLRAH